MGGDGEHLHRRAMNVYKEEEEEETIRKEGEEREKCVKDTEGKGGEGSGII